jgi:predicted kinase
MGYLMLGTKATLVLMAGLPGAGKTTLARALGREFQWHVIDKDGHKEVLLSKGIEEEQAGNAAYAIAFRTIRNELAQRASVILDTASLHTSIVEKAREIARSFETAQLKIILCVADRDLRNHRLRNRPEQITRIKMDPATIADYFECYSHLPSGYLIVYTRNPLEKCLAEAKSYLLEELVIKLS